MKKTDELNSSSQSGFTLLEVAIASLLMMIVGLGAASVFYYAIGYNSGGNSQRVAATLAQDVIERYRRATFDQTTAPNPATYTATGADGQPYSVQIIVDPLSGTLKKVTVTVSPSSGSSRWARQPFSEHLLKSKPVFGANSCDSPPC